MFDTRMSRAATLAITAGVVIALGLSAPSAAATVARPGAAADATPTAVALPISTYAHMVIDPVHDHLFITGGSGDDVVLITDYSGQAVATIGNQPGADGLALSTDGSTVYVALADGQAVSAISTATLTETARYATGVDTSSVAYTAGRIWFGYDGAFAGEAGIGSIDPSTTPATVTLAATHDSWYSAPMIAANPDGELVAAQPDMSPVELASYDVANGVTALAPQTYVDSTVVASNLRDLQITPDGSDVVTADGAPYEHLVFTVADLSLVGQYDDEPYPNSVTISADGTVMGGLQGTEPAVYVFTQGNPSAVATLTLPSGTAAELAPAGLAVTPDGTALFAISTAAGGNTSPVLNILPDPEQTAATLTATGPASSTRGKALTLTGTLEGNAPYTGGQTLQVTRTDPSDPNGVSLPDVTTAPDGTFSITDTPRVKGSVTYRITYAGDAHLAAATTTVTVKIN